MTGLSEIAGVTRIASTFDQIQTFEIHLDEGICEMGGLASV